MSVDTITSETTVKDSGEKTSSSLFEMLTSIFGRVTSNGMFIPEIDGLRFVAIMSVILYHTTDSLAVKTAEMAFEYKTDNYLSWLFLQGSCGVPLFFIISGFILALPFIKSQETNSPPVSLRKFYLRRLTRLEPPYIVNLILILVLLCVVKHESLSDLWKPFLASLFYVHNFVYEKPSQINVVAWSLEVEAQFYLLAPFIFYYLFKLKFDYRMSLCFLIMFATSYFRLNGSFGNSKRIELSLLGKYEYFLAGIILADCYFRYKNQLVNKSLKWDLISIFCWILIPYFWSKNYLMPFLPYPAMLAYWGAFQGKVFNSIFKYTPLVLVGGMCYSIYLYHFLFISVVGERTIRLLTVDNYYLYLLLQTSVISICSIIGCSVFFVLIEKPFMKWKLT